MTRYTKDHEWVRANGDRARIGISVYAAEKLGPIIGFDFPEAGRPYVQGEEIGAVDSVKAASAIYTPVSGAILAINSALEARPELANEAAESEGYFCEISLSNPGELDALMDEAAYRAYIAGL